MKKLKLLSILALASIVFFTGCKKDDYKETVNVCPLVVSTIPADKAVNVPLSQIISATFNEKMNPATITSASFSVQQGATITAGLKSASLLTPVAGTISYSGETASFTPSSPLIPNTVYTGRVTTAAKDLIGQALQADYVWTFTTIARVTLASNPTIGGTTSGAGTFNQGASVTVVATPGTGYAFTNWTENGVVVSTNSSYQFTMAANRALVANFSLQFTVTLSSNPVLGGTTLGAGLYTTGTSVTALALPNTEYTFVNWTDNATVASTNASYVFVLTANRTLVANFALKTYTLVVTATNGTVVKNPVLVNYNSGSTVQLTATPNAGYTFTSWSGDATGSTNPLTVMMNANKAITANFSAIQYTIALSSNPLSGGTTTGAGSYNSGASVIVRATPAVGFTFTNWTEGANIVSSNANYTFNISANRTLVANFTANIAQFLVSLSSNPILGGTTSGGGSFNSGTSVTVNAIQAVGYTFTNWTEGANTVSSSANYTFNINANRTLVANFAPITAEQFLVVLSSNPLLGGNTNGAGSFNSGTSVTITAIPNSGYKFTNWTEGVNIISLNANYTFTINENRNFVANFDADVPPAGPLAIDLGCAAPFAILAGSTITSTGPSIITGDVGLSPGSALIGFPPGIINGTQQITTPIAAAAKLCLTTAFIDGQSRSLNAISLPGQLGGLTLAPGLYSNSSTSGISGTGANGILTLAGNANDVWIFQMGSTLTTDPATSIVLAGGAQAKNIFWIVGSSATLGTTSVFYGNILADQAITLNTGAVLNGRALTRIAAVTLDASIITKP